MLLPIITAGVNTAFLVIALLITMILVHAGAIHAYNYGISAVQEKYKWRILKCLLGILVLGAAAALFNVVSALLG